MNIWIAALAAVLVQPLVVLVRLAPDYFASRGQLYGIEFMLVAVLAVAAATVLLLGIPIFLVLQKFHRVSWSSLAISGFLLGGLLAAFSWPKHLEGFSAGLNWHGTYVNTYVNGIPTKYAWFTYAEGILFFALHGLVGALMFYAVFRKQKRHEIK